MKQWLRLLHNPLSRFRLHSNSRPWAVKSLKRLILALHLVLGSPTISLADLRKTNAFDGEEKEEGFKWIHAQAGNCRSVTAMAGQ
jgi:hypothetical protein